MKNFLDARREIELLLHKPIIISMDEIIQIHIQKKLLIFISKSLKAIKN